MGRASRLKAERRDTEKREMRRIAEIDDRPLMVVTSLGNTILSPDSRVFVRVSDNQYVQKTASDLKEGEQVIYAKEGIDIEQHRSTMDSLLMQGRKYRNAMASLFAETSEGYTTKFRVELLRGPVEQPMRWPSELTLDQMLLERVIRNKADLTPEMYELAAETIHAKLLTKLAGKEIQVVSLAHVQNGWLAGNVIAPRHFKDVFEALGDISPGLARLLLSPDFERDYHIYLAMRLSISLRLTNIMEGKGTSPAAKPKPSHSHLDEEARRELDEVVEYFGDSISRRHAIASVVRVEPVRKSQEIEMEKNKERLRKGVVTRKPDDVEIEVLTPTDIMKMRGILVDYAEEISELYSDIKNPQIEVGGKSLNKERDRYEYIEFLNLAIDYLIAKLGYENERANLDWAFQKMDEVGLVRSAFGRRNKDPEYVAMLEKLANQMYQSLISGEFDIYLGLEQGSLLKIMKAFGKNANVAPREFVYSRALRELKAYYLELGKDTTRVQKEIDLTDKLLARKGYPGSYHTPRSFWINAIEKDRGLLGK
ncbi:MAG TPA: hypothetical protein VJH24_00005, partial [Candidatus Bilamarchaeaceae archaeon]|nr:hypothetical protein [Candidatus Bilamarchaeaceae archaeon]